jgi:hypothetical protein
MAGQAGARSPHFALLIANFAFYIELALRSLPATAAASFLLGVTPGLI